MRGISLKIALIGLLLLAGSLASVSYFLYQSWKKEIAGSIAEELRGLASTGALLIDAETHENIFMFEGEMEGQDDFDALKLILQKIQEVNHLTRPLYTMRKAQNFEASGNLEFVVMTNLNSEGEIYTGFQIAATPYAREVFKTGLTQTTDIYRDEEGVWISALAPIKGAQGEVVAILSVDRGVAFYFAHLREKQQIIWGAALICLAVAALVFLLLTRPIVGRIKRLAKGAAQISQGNLDYRIPVKGSDELSELGSAFNNMTERLQDFYQNLDEKVRRGKQNIRMILDNVQSGFLAFDAEGSIQPEYSRVAEGYFGPNLVERKIWDILGGSDLPSAEIKQWIQILFAGALPFDDAQEIGPGQIVLPDNLYIELNYRPVFVEKKLTYVILIAQDKSQERAMEAEAEREKGRARMILSLASDPEGFIHFCEETQGALQASLVDLQGEGWNREKLERLFRVIHTVKGNSAMYDLGEIHEECQGLEEELALFQNKQEIPDFPLETLAPRVAQLKSMVRSCMDKNRLLLGNEAGQGASKRIVIPREVMEEMQTLVRAPAGDDALWSKLFSEYILKQPLLPLLHKFAGVLEFAAQAQNKKIGPVQWAGEEVRVSLGKARRLVPVLVHFFRNCADHGIEYPEERALAGKPEFAVVKVSLSRAADNQVTLKFSDDGRGLDINIIRQRLLDLQLFSEAELRSINDGEILPCIFLDGFTSKKEGSQLSGRGVGLGAIKEEVEALGGKIRVESISGQGTTFILTWPD